MKLSEWLKAKDKDHSAFAAEVGVHPVSISKYAVGIMVPRPEIAERISRATGGAVTADDLSQAYIERRTRSLPSQQAGAA